MAAPPQPSTLQIQQMQAQFAAEAAKRGMTPQQFQQVRQQQISAEAAKRGMPVEQYVAELKANIMKQHQAQQQAQAQGGGHNHGNQPHVHGQGQSQPQQIAIKPGSPPAPEALAVAKFLRSQDLKPRTCIYNGDRKDMFKVKRALRALQSPAYTKAQQKANSNLPPVTDLESAQKTFTLLPISWLALQVSKSDPHEGHNHGPSKPQKNRTKGLWTVKVDQHMGTDPLAHYVWLYQGPQWKQKVYAAGALAIIMAIVMFPLWPITLRLGVWYLSMGLLGLLGLFFLMAIFRLILFCVTVFTVRPGLWLFPNLFEDVGVIDSFKPLWGWQPPPKQKRSKGEMKAIKASESAEPTTNSTLSSKTTEPATPTPVKSASLASNGAATSTAVPKPTSAPTQRREYSATVEEADDE